MAQVDGGYSSGNWGEPAAWGCSVYYPVISNAGWGLGAWGYDVWGLGNGGLVSASDTVGYLAAKEGTVSETANAADETSGNITTAVISFVSESSNIADTTSANANFVVTVQETVNAESIVSTLGIFVVTVSETGNVTDLVFPNGVFAQNISESVTAQDIVNRRSLWEPIDTGITEDWVLINTY